MAPSESKRFSINIAAQDNNLFDNILFHFNPRQRERGGQLVVNDKRDMLLQSGCRRIDRYDAASVIFVFVVAYNLNTTTIHVVASAYRLRSSTAFDVNSSNMKPNDRRLQRPQRPCQ
jgi:hypothetical protein